MKHLREAVRKKRPDAWRLKRWMLHADNAPAHISLLIRQFLVKHETTGIPQPPYSPDLAPADFFFIPQIKNLVERLTF
jgi:histone-lysine N-methyltransferase SETMAR